MFYKPECKLLLAKLFGTPLAMESTNPATGTNNLNSLPERWNLARRIITLLLLIGLCTSSVILIGKLRSYPLPGNQRGYEPEQPIAFSHRQHAGDLQITCLYCHYGAERSQHAGVPAADVCRPVIASSRPRKKK